MRFRFRFRLLTLMLVVLAAALMFTGLKTWLTVVKPEPLFNHTTLLPPPLPILPPEKPAR
jgi:hypothetical protein